MRIAIICEFKERELLFLTILKQKLEIDNHEVKIIPSRLLTGWKLLLFKPDVVIVNGLRSEKSYIKQIYTPKKLYNSLIVSLYSEQVGTLEGIAHTYDNKLILDDVDAHIAWGEGFAEGLKEIGVPKEKIWINGSFALDIPFFLKNKDDIKKSFARKYSLDHKKKWILISDNIINLGQFKKDYKKLRKEFDGKIKKIADHFNDCEVIFRPHPANGINEVKEIKKFFIQNDNISIIGSNHNIVWSALCDVMIIWRSTSSIESWSLNKEVFSIKTETGDYDYWHKEFTEIYIDENKLIKDLDNYFKDEFSYDINKIKKRERYLNKWFYNNDGESFDRLCKIISKVMSNKNIISNGSKSINFIKVYRYFIMEIFVYLKKIINGQHRKYYIAESDINNQNEVLDDIRKYTKTYSDVQGKNGHKLSSLGAYKKMDSLDI
jgi:hypothetical protein